MYRKSIRIKNTYTLKRQPSKSYVEKETFHLVKDIIGHKQEIFEVEGRQGFARIVMQEGTVINAYSATWNSYRVNDQEKVLNKFMQISKRAFIDIYSSLSHKDSWFDVATKLLLNKQQKLSQKIILTKTEKELLEL